MNVEALTEDLYNVVVKHGLSANARDDLIGLLTLAVKPGASDLIKRALSGATLFAVDDSGSVAMQVTQPTPVNGRWVNRLLDSVAPATLPAVLQMVIDEINTARRDSDCNCSKCVAARSGSHNPIDKGAAEAHSRSKH